MPLAPIGKDNWILYVLYGAFHDHLQQLQPLLQGRLYYWFLRQELLAENYFPKYYCAINEQAHYFP